MKRLVHATCSSPHCHGEGHSTKFSVISGAENHLKVLMEAHLMIAQPLESLARNITLHVISHFQELGKVEHLGTASEKAGALGGGEWDWKEGEKNDTDTLERESIRAQLYWFRFLRPWCSTGWGLWVQLTVSHLSKSPFGVTQEKVGVADDPPADRELSNLPVTGNQRKRASLRAKSNGRGVSAHYQMAFIASHPQNFQGDLPSFRVM